MTFKDSKANETFDDVEAKLSQYLVKYPDEVEIDETIATLRQYVPSKPIEKSNYNYKLKKLLNFTKLELPFINKFYWIVSILLFVIGYLITYGVTYNPVATLITLAPIPFLLGILEVFKGRDQGLLEIEMSCLFSPNEIMLSRILIISIFNLFLNTTLTISFLPLFEDLNLSRVLLLWLIPFMLFAALALWISMRIKGSKFVMTSLPIWTILSNFLVTDLKYRTYIFEMHIALYLLILMLGSIMFLFQLKQITTRYSKFEGAEGIGINY